MARSTSGYFVLSTIRYVVFDHHFYLCGDDIGKTLKLFEIFCLIMTMVHGVRRVA